MSKLSLDQGVSTVYSPQSLANIIRSICGQLNNLSEGRLAARYNAQASVPTGTAVAYAVGDFIPDNNCTVSASVVAGLGAAYIRLGWVCVAPSPSATLQEVRVLTGGGTGYPSASTITNSLGADVALNNIANYFDGPSVAQGTVGTWDVSGTVTLSDTAGAAAFDCKLWDGTTVIASCRHIQNVANNPISVCLSGRLASPAGNLRISVIDISSTSGKIAFNLTGNSKDSTITAIRIG